MKNLYKLFGLPVLLFTVFSPFFVFAASPTNEGVATANEVLVVYNSSYTIDSDNDSTQDSLELANYYANKRSIPNDNVVGIDAPTNIAINRSEYNSYIKTPLEDYLNNNNLKNTIKYIVFIKGIPLKIYDTSGVANNYSNITGDYSSVDSSTTLLFQNSYIGTSAQVANPYYKADKDFSLNYRFKSHTFGDTEYKISYLVTRLDGYTVADVKNMIDRSFNSNKSAGGYFVLDQYSGGNNFSFDSMQGSAKVLKGLGKNIYPDPFNKGSSAIKNISQKVIGYTSYGIYGSLGNDYYNNELNFSYINGAVASTYESYSAFSMTEPDNTNHGQIAQFIRAGGSGGIGNVYEPFSLAIARENVWMPAYSVGYTWADAAYMSLPYIDWTSVVFGDPLMSIVNSSIYEPSVSIKNYTNISNDSVTLNAVVNNTGGESNLSRGFVYGKTNDYGTFANNTGSFGTGDFSIDLSGLDCNTTYYYKAYSTNSFRSGYSQEVSFTTSICAVPVVETNSASSVTVSGASLQGTIITVGQGSVTKRGFEVGTNTNYGTSFYDDGSFGTGSYSVDADNLECNTLYHYRAFALNTTGYGYGDDRTFTTGYNCKPVVATGNSNYSNGSFTLSADILNVGGDAVTERGFEFGLDSNYGSSVKETGLFGGSFGYLSKFGSYGSLDGQFDQPRSVAVDSNGNIYVADRLNHRIQKFDSSGTFIKKWGSFGSNNSQFKYPRGIAVDSNNNIYVADSDNHRIQKFDSNGNYITKWGNYGTGNGKISYPQDVVIDSNNNVYVSDYDNSRITKFSSTGSYITKWGSYGSGNGQFSPAYDLAVDSNNNIYVADRNNNRVQKFDSNGGYLMQFGSYGIGDGQFIFPSGIVVDSSGYIYVSDENNRIQKFNSSGAFVAKTGGFGNINGAFNNPQGMTFDKFGNIYVAELSNARIQKISTSGSFSGVVSNLTCGATYNYRAYAVNSIGTSYGANKTFSVPVCLGKVTTDASSNVTNSSARLSATITDFGGETPSIRGFEIGTDTSYGKTTNNTPEKTSIPLGQYIANVKGLACNTVYNYRSYIKNSAGIAYGLNKTFKTSVCP